MADVFVVLLAKGGGEVGPAFSTFALANTFVTTLRPPCNYSIVQRTIDDAVGSNLVVNYLLPSSGTTGVVKQGHRNS